MMTNDTPSSSVTHSAHWDQKYLHTIRSSWTENPYIQRAVNERMTGDSGMHWLNWVFTKFLPDRPARVLSVGCGDGSHELIIARQSYADFVYGFDASSVGIEMASRAAREESLAAEFETRLFEDFVSNPPPEPFDVALFAGSLHHVRDIEGMLFTIQNVVKPGGHVIINEYVGPAYQLYDELQLRLVNLLLDLLPPELVADPAFRVRTPTMRTVYATDPSEGIRAPLIPQLLPRFFSPVLVRKMNGALLHPLFDGINGTTANIETSLNQRVFDSLVALEQILTDLRVLSNDFMFAVYRNDLE